MKSAWLGALLFPQRVSCHLCGDTLRIGDGGYLCEECQRALNACRFAEPAQADAPIPSASAYRHDAGARDLVHALKYGADRAAAIPLAEGMAAVFAQEPQLARCEVLVFVPAHPTRKRERGYNQAEVLCDAFAELCGLSMARGALCRVKPNGSQVGKNREERLQNVRGVFAVADASAFQHRRVLLLDDVLTTGATSQACAEILLEAGASEVAVLTACRA